MDAGLVAGGASKSVTECSLSQNGLLFPDVLVSLNTVPTAPAKESRVRRPTPPYRCSGVTGCFAVMSGTSPVELLFLAGSPRSMGNGLPPPASAARGEEAHAIIVATLPPKNTRRETAISAFSLLNLFCLAWRTRRAGKLGKAGGASRYLKNAILGMGIFQSFKPAVTWVLRYRFAT